MEFKLLPIRVSFFEDWLKGFSRTIMLKVKISVSELNGLSSLTVTLIGYVPIYYAFKLNDGFLLVKIQELSKSPKLIERLGLSSRSGSTRGGSKIDCSIPKAS